MKYHIPQGALGKCLHFHVYVAVNVLNDVRVKLKQGARQAFDHGNTLASYFFCRSTRIHPAGHCALLWSSYSAPPVAHSWQKS